MLKLKKGFELNGIQSNSLESFINEQYFRIKRESESSGL